MSARTPLHPLTGKAGAVFAEEAGWLVPAHFGDPALEYAGARDQAALFDVSHRGKVELTGADAVPFLHNLCTNDIKNLAPGTGCEAFLTTAKAKAVAHLHVWCSPPGQSPASLWLDVAPGGADAVVKHLDHYLISEQVEIADRTTDFGQLHLSGPRAGERLSAAFDVLPPALGEESVLPLPGSSLCIRRNDPLGLPGYDLLCPNVAAAAVWEKLIARGVLPAGRDSYEVLRVEAGTPVFGADIDAERMVVEVGRGTRAICYTKGCFLGQEPIVMARDRGHVNRTLLGLKVAVESPVPHGARVFRDGAEVGVVTSSVRSPRVGGVIALAYLRRGNQEPGTRVEVEAAGGRCPAEVSALPFGGAAVP
jgi:tRNA-modifying protein YgfZ